MDGLNEIIPGSNECTYICHCTVQEESSISPDATWEDMHINIRGVGR